MMDAHVSQDLLERMARRELHPDEIVLLARHLEGCTACAALAREYSARDLANLRVALTTPPSPRLHRGWKFAIAASAVAAMIVVALWLTSRDTTAPRRAVPERARATQPRPVTPLPRGEELPEWDRLRAEATATGTLPFPSELAELRGSADVVRGPAGQQSNVDPAGVVIEDARPAFTWPARDAGRYVVYVFDGEHEIVHSPELRQTTWRPERDLPRGRTLSWQVEVIDGERIETIPRPPVPPARLRIATEADLREIERARMLRPHDELLHAVLYARAGLRAQALAALHRVPSSDVTDKLLDRYVNRR